MINFDVICFDVDSTLVQCEGLDWLAGQKGVGTEVKELTDKSMNGEVPIQDVFGKKLDIIKPSIKELQLLGEFYCSQLTDGVEDMIDTLRQLGVDIWLVTGSFTHAVYPLAAKLGINQNHIHANEVHTNELGEYRGINLDCTLTQASGKAICAKAIAGDRKSAFVGDSVTDLATQSVVSTFIGYGGVVTRQRVKDEAEYFIKTRDLSPLLTLVY